MRAAREFGVGSSSSSSLGCLFGCARGAILCALCFYLFVLPSLFALRTKIARALFLAPYP